MRRYGREGRRQEGTSKREDRQERRCKKNTEMDGWQREETREDREETWESWEANKIVNRRQRGKRRDARRGARTTI